MIDPRNRPIFYASAIVGLALAAALVAGVASGEIYRWVDEKGDVHFAQELYQVPQEYRHRVETGPGSGNYSQLDPSQRAGGEEEREKGVGRNQRPSSAQASGAGEAGPLGGVVELLRSQGIDISTNLGFGVLLLGLPLSALALYLTLRMLREEDEHVAVKSLIGAFFHRIGAAAGLAILAFTGTVAGLPAMAVVHLAAAIVVLAFLFSSGLGRALMGAVVFFFVDNTLLLALLIGYGMVAV